jgi:glycine cleavage system H protein
MTPLLVLAMFAAFIAIDYFLNRKKIPVLAPSALEKAPVAVAPDFIAGFHVPSNLQYHPGHTWVARERKNVQKVGADELAAILAGPVDRIEIPKPGSWIRQGEKVVALFRGEEKIELVSPVEGEITAVNHEILSDPNLLRQDPYGKGWMMTVYSPDEEGPSRNLLPLHLLKSWMTEAAEGFYRLVPNPAGVTAADGGVPSKDATTGMSIDDWKKAAREFLLN